MKKTSIILSAAALICAAAMTISCSNAPQAASTNEASDAVSLKGAIVYFNLDTVSQEYDMANDLRSVVETKVQSISEEVNRRGNKLQKDVNSFQEKIDKGLITRSVAEVQGQKLQQQQNEFQNYAAQKQQEIGEEQAVMMNQIADAIKTFVDKYAEEQGFALVLTTQGDVLPAPVVAGKAELDITQAIIDGLNAEYVAEKAKTEKK
ncbi:MAG: OmpH family outer membrane protein [Bacteroidales bacterium]|nr:OmpH family outer membrane protein [Candidatus Cryptobacteroides onthequi]MCQ2164538.1 OmpH family outer membrane protein [Bacteroidales bacterium]